jgi:hypothetical protein
MNPYAVPLDVVFADGPAPDFADKLQLFGQFVGSWELEATIDLSHDRADKERIHCPVLVVWSAQGIGSSHDVLPIWQQQADRCRVARSTAATSSPRSDPGRPHPNSPAPWSSAE